jgi:hypothetical protein
MSGLSLVQWIILHSVFEVWENSQMGISFFQWSEPILFQTVGGTRRGSNYKGDRIQNSIGDTIAAIIGWWFIKKIYKL